VPARPTLIEFPADDPDRARRFWSDLLGDSLGPRGEQQGEGWQTAGEQTAIGVHARGRGPGDTASLPYFAVDDLNAALNQVTSLGGTVIHPGERWAICRDSEGSPFGLALGTAGEPLRTPGEPLRTPGEPLRTPGEPLRTPGEP
jgi:predicted enzyme related to lactoylglutathione lyase